MRKKRLKVESRERRRAGTNMQKLAASGDAGVFLLDGDGLHCWCAGRCLKSGIISIEPRKLVDRYSKQILQAEEMADYDRAEICMKS